ncbi:3-oxo-5-alpha-steroid 4-dehydrogenase [Mortierella claussenii]|nr:3-oxo-5-alpha-steroid 4-dehydrogenase [Mortierella claussenii]
MLDSRRTVSVGILASASVPFGDWFEYLVAPHYSAEMIMYLALYLMVSSCGKGGQAPTLLVAWVWVVVNLGIVAKETDQWYRTRFGEDYAEPAGTPARNQGQVHIKRKQRAILVPFVY